MSNPIRIVPEETTALIFRIKKFQYNSYFIDHPTVKGILRVGNIPTDILKIPETKIPPDVDVEEEAKYILGYQSVVAFTNQNKKKNPSEKQPDRNELKKLRKMELTNYLIQEQTFEPWNEFVIQGTIPKLLKTRTILGKIQWYPDVINRLGDPSIWAFHNTNFTIGEDTSPEGGMT